MTPVKYVFIDTETTGTNPHKHGVVQIAGIVVFEVTKGIFEERDRFQFEVAPFPTDEIDDKALAVNGRTVEQIKAYRQPVEVFRDLTSILGKHIDKFDRFDKAFFVGYNVRFDNDFLRQFWEKCGDKYFGSFFWNPPLDVMSLALKHLRFERDKLPDFKLGTVARFMDIQPDGSLHDAMVDANLTLRVWVESVIGVR